MWSWNSWISLTLLSYCTAFGPPILITLSVLSPPKKLKLQYSTLWPYSLTLWVFPLPCSSHFTCFLASQSVPVSWLPHFSPSNAFPSLLILHSQVGCLNSPLSANLDYFASLCLYHIAQENPNAESTLQPPFSIPIATHQLHTADKSQDVLRVGSTTYSWLQILSEPLAPPTNALTCS